jgi:hypothetical protein
MASTGGSLINTRFGNSSVGSSSFFLQRAEGTIGSPSVLTGGNQALGRIFFRGYNGTAYVNGSRISSVVDGTAPSASNMGSKLTFDTSNLTALCF